MTITTGCALALLLLAAVAGQGSAAEEGRSDTVLGYLIGRYDKDGDGRVSRAEYKRTDQHWARLDRDEDGFITAADLDGPRRGRPDLPRTEPPKKGAVAPDFELEVLPPGGEPEGAKKDKEKDKKKEVEPRRVKLSSFAGKKPVALVFGSYT